MNFSWKLTICAVMLVTGWFGCSICINLTSHSQNCDAQTEVDELLQLNDSPLAITAASVDMTDPIQDRQLDELLTQSIGQAGYEPSTKEELSRFEQRMLRTLEQTSTPLELEQGWSEDGWQLIYWTYNGQSFAAICEQEHELRGRGFYVIRFNSNSNLVLQAPHRFYDMGSGTIVSALFQENDCQAAAWNTVHRKQFDLAHRRDSFLNAFTRAILKFNDESIVVQIHGFENDKQKGPARSAQLIVSNATEYPGRIAREASIRFKENFGRDNVRLYPLEVRQLGGTKNEQARVVYEIGSVGFLHLELNKNFREQLQISPALRAKFYDSLAPPVSISGVSSNR